MRGVFDDEEFERAPPKRDTELTLGAGTLLLIFFGLVLVCGLCFGLGYAVGHRGNQSQVAASQLPPAGTRQMASPAGSLLPKPSATTQAAVPPPAQSTTPQGVASQPGATDLPQSTASVAMSVGPGQSANQAATANGQMQVRPALASQANVPQAAPAGNGHPVQPPVQATPLPSVIPLWVQIAAVSHQEDAEVLSNALRKRGYTVTARREPEDNLIHVRIGPFATREEANRWRLKLLNDGYNAMIQP
jgi:DedD protein